MKNNMQDKWQEVDSNVEEPVFGEVVQPTLCDLVIHFMLSHWKAIIFLVIILVAGLTLNLCLSVEDPSGVTSEERTMTAPPTAIDNMLIEGVYYGEYTSIEKCEPFPATVTRSSNGVDHYLLSSQGQVYDFWRNKEDGTLTSSSLGSGTIEIDTVTNEIIIKFKGWILKR